MDAIRRKSGTFRATTFVRLNGYTRLTRVVGWRMRRNRLNRTGRGRRRRCGVRVAVVRRRRRLRLRLRYRLLPDDCYNVIL